MIRETADICTCSEMRLQAAKLYLLHGGSIWRGQPSRRSVESCGRRGGLAVGVEDNPHTCLASCFPLPWSAAAHLLCERRFGAMLQLEGWVFFSSTFFYCRGSSTKGRDYRELFPPDIPLIIQRNSGQTRRKEKHITKPGNFQTPKDQEHFRSFPFRQEEHIIKVRKI